MSVLEQIVDHKRAEVAERQRRRPPAVIRQAAAESPPPRDFPGALRPPGLSVIAEIKRRSPARGDLRPALDPAALARCYAEAGASALSVLTDERYFRGSDADLVAAREATSLPVLRKDFIIDPYQIYEARALGADAVLLIVRALSDQLLRELQALALELGLAALVEVHDLPELERAVVAEARIIGINNRNLDTLEVDPTTSLRLRPAIPPGVIAVAESGIGSSDLAAQLAAVGFDAILVGEALVTAPDPGALLQRLRQAGQRAP